MLYTVISADDIFYTEPQPKKVLQKTPYCFLEYEKNAVTAVCSTDPMDYFRYSLGCKVNNAGK